MKQKDSKRSKLIDSLSGLQWMFSPKRSSEVVRREQASSKIQLNLLIEQGCTRFVFTGNITGYLWKFKEA